MSTKIHSHTSYKSDFPLLSKRKIVYLDSAATTQKPSHVIDAVKNYLEQSNANIHRGGYDISDESAEIYTRSKDVYHSLVQANDSYSSVYSANATHAINEIALMLDASDHLMSGDEILIQMDNHHANIVPWMILAQKTGAKITWFDTRHAPADICNDLKAALTERTKIVALTLVTNVTGAIYPWHDLGVLLGKKVISIVDASQALPHHLLNVSDLDASFSVTTAHKYYSLTGIGIYTAKSDLLRSLTPGIGGGGAINFVRESGFEFAGMPYRHEPGTPHTLGALSLLKAIEYTQDKKEQMRQNEEILSAYFLKRFDSIADRFEMLRSPNMAHISIFSLCPRLGHIADYSDYLASHHIAIRSGQHCCEPYYQSCSKSGSIRVSLGMYSEREDIDQFFDILTASYEFV